MRTPPQSPDGDNPFAPPPRTPRKERRRGKHQQGPQDPAAPQSPAGGPQQPPPQGGHYGAPPPEQPPGQPQPRPDRYGAPPVHQQPAQPPQGQYGAQPSQQPAPAQGPPPQAPPAHGPAPAVGQPPAPPASDPAASDPGAQDPDAPVDPQTPAGSRLPGEPVPPPPDAGRAEGDGTEAEWRRLHRVTPLLNAWKVGAVVFAIALYNSQEFMSDLREMFPAMAILGAVVGLLVMGFLIGLFFSYLGWRRTTYGVSRESVFLHKGVISRQQRHVRLDRVQAIEVTQPLVARMFGFASLKVESAGGSAANLTLAFLTETDARGLRNELLARAAGVKGRDSGATGAEGAPGASPVEERQISALSPGRLVGSLALSISAVFAVLALVGIIAAAIAIGNVGIVFGAVAPMLGAAFYVWGRFAGEFNFRVAISPDGIRLRHGLLETKSRTVPPGRVQAVAITQPVLWRAKDWWRIQVNIAGYGAEETTGTVLYPAATRAEVAFMLSLVLPDLGDDRPLPVLHTGMDGVGTDEGFTTSPRRARWVDPFTWRHTAFRITNTAILMRTGRWWRRLSVVPHERTQSLGLTQGPIERKMGLATFVVHSTPGPVATQVHHLELGVAGDLLVGQAERSRQARRTAGPERWRSTEETPQPVGAAGAAGAAQTAADSMTLRREYAGVLPSRVIARPPSADAGPSSAGARPGTDARSESSAGVGTTTDAGADADSGRAWASPRQPGPGADQGPTA